MLDRGLSEAYLPLPSTVISWMSVSGQAVAKPCKSPVHAGLQDHREEEDGSACCACIGKPSGLREVDGSVSGP